MEDSKLEKIKELAAIAFEKTERFHSMGIMNIPKEYEARKKKAIEYAVAQAEMREAVNNLETTSRAKLTKG